MKTEAITFVKEDILSLGQMVNTSVAEMASILRFEPKAKFETIERREELIDDSCHAIEEKCMDILVEKDMLDVREVRTIIGSIIIAAKFERLADHALRTSRMMRRAQEEGADIPPQLAEMADIVHRMIDDVLLGFVADDEKKAEAVSLQDHEVNYLHDLLSKELLSDLGEQDQGTAQMRAQFLFCARFLERMGDACASIARRVFFIVTGKHLKKQSVKINL